MTLSFCGRSLPAAHALVILLTLTSASAAASTSGDDSPSDEPAQQGAPPVSAEGIATSPDGRLQIQAVKAPSPIVIDGTLDDDAWRLARPVGGFVQGEPLTGEAATEETRVRMAFDAQALYIAAELDDSDPEGLVVNDIRKDFKNGNQDSFEIIIDTFADRRNGFVFMTNPEGARSDQQVAMEGRETNASWDGIWFVKTRRTGKGWVAEIAIPFKTLRFEGGATQRWGINFARHIRRKNELDYWSPVPRAYTLSRVSLAGDLVGLESLDSGRNLRVKPYVLGRGVRPTGGATFDNDVEVGADIKYGVTPALTFDATVNPDFAQVEADEQQVNFTQFSQFFPEKRDFFLENSGIFYVGDMARNNRINVSPTPDEDLLLFFSRRIGLTSEGLPIPLLAGARLTGRAAGLNLGLLNVQTRDFSGPLANNYTVLRARRNVARTSDVGLIYMARQSTDPRGDANHVYGGDWNLRLPRQVDWNTYAVRTTTPGATSGQYAWRSSLTYEGTFFHSKAALLEIGDHFRSDLSYFRRIGTRKYLLDTGVRPRTAWLRGHGIREVHPHIVWNYYEDLHRDMNGKRLHSGLSLFFNDGGFMEYSENPVFELLTTPLRLSPLVPPLPPGGYGWTEHQLRVSTDPSRAVSGNVTVIGGGFWSGTQNTVNAAITFKPGYRLGLSVGLQHTEAELEAPSAGFTTNFWTLRANYSFSTNMFFDSLVQYLSDRRQFNANLRFNFIHRPLSDLYVVYNEQQFYTAREVTPGRGVIVKFTQMMAF